MKSTRYFVGNCMDCKGVVLMKLDYLEFEKNCCLDFKNVKILKTFNDEAEARNYIKLYQDEETE